MTRNDAVNYISDGGRRRHPSLASRPMYVVQWGQIIIASSSIIPSPITSTATATGS
jgi:hypothetical protein